MTTQLQKQFFSQILKLLITARVFVHVVCLDSYVQEEEQRQFEASPCSWWGNIAPYGSNHSYASLWHVLFIRTAYFESHITAAHARTPRNRPSAQALSQGKGDVNSADLTHSDHIKGCCRRSAEHEA